MLGVWKSERTSDERVLEKSKIKTNLCLLSFEGGNADRKEIVERHTKEMKGKAAAVVDDEKGKEGNFMKRS